MLLRSIGTRVRDALPQAPRLVGVVAGAPLLPGLPGVVVTVRRRHGLLSAQLSTYSLATMSVGSDGAS